MRYQFAFVFLGVLSGLLAGCAGEAGQGEELGREEEALCNPACDVLVTGVKPTSIALDSSNAFFTNNFSLLAELDKVPLAGGVRTVVASSPLTMTGVVRLGGSIYWADISTSNPAAGVWRASTSGGAATQLSHHEDDLVSGKAVAAYTTGSGILTTTHVLFGDALHAKLWSRSSNVFATSEVSLLPDTDPVTHLNYYPFSLVMDSAQVYFTHDSGGGVWRAPLSGGAATQLVAGAERAVLAISGSTLYFEQSNAIKTIAVTGGAITTFASSVGTVSSMAASGGNLYWTCSSCGTVVKKPLGGGSSIVLASGQSNPHALAVDSTHVYFGTDTALKRVLK